MKLETKKFDNFSIDYAIYGSGKINLVIESGLDATIGEWENVVNKLKETYTVLCYERSTDSKNARTPKNIAAELQKLLASLDCEKKVIIVAHSQGGLYANAFARLYPQLVKGLVLLDPLSPNDNKYKELLTPEEQNKSGFDKSENLKLMLRFAKLHLGIINKSVLKKAPPFYYCSKFSPEAEKYILSKSSSAASLTAAIEEYRLAHEKSETESLSDKTTFPNIPLVLITHSSDYEIKEIEQFGNTTHEFAVKVEDIWQNLMKEYLDYSTLNRFLSAKSSGHYIHLTEPKLIDKALDYISKFPD